MTALPPVLELDAVAPKSTKAAALAPSRPEPKRKVAHFAYAFGQWFTTTSDPGPEFVLA